MVDSNDRERIQEGAAVLQKMVSMYFKLIISKIYYGGTVRDYIPRGRNKLGKLVISKFLRMHKKAF